VDTVDPDPDSDPDIWIRIRNTEKSMIQICNQVDGSKYMDPYQNVTDPEQWIHGSDPDLVVV
jgi:hypothetical protein